MASFTLLDFRKSFLGKHWYEYQSIHLIEMVDQVWPTIVLAPYISSFLDFVKDSISKALTTFPKSGALQTFNVYW